MIQNNQYYKQSESSDGVIEGGFCIKANQELCYFMAHPKGIDNTSFVYAKNFKSDTDIYFLGEEFVMETDMLPKMLYRKAVLLENIKGGYKKGSEIYIVTHPKKDIGELLSYVEQEPEPKIMDIVKSSKKRAEALFNHPDPDAVFFF